MQSLTALIRGTRADDPLALALEALLDSGLIIFSRDTQGNFVQLSEVLSDRVGIIADAGTSQPRNLRVFDENGRLLPGSEYPAAITRRTGEAQRDVLRRLVSDDDREIWLKMSTLPLERGPEGWSVLTVGTDVTDLQEQITTAQREVAARGALLELSTRLTPERTTIEELIAAFADPLELLLPERNVFLALRDGDEFETTPLVHGYGNPIIPSRARYTEDQRTRWTSRSAHVNLDVQDTDIYGARVVAEFSYQVRSIVIAPCYPHGGDRVGAIVALADSPGAFTDDQIATLETAARMLGGALSNAVPLAQAS